MTNEIKATVEEIFESDFLHVVKFGYNGIKLSMMSLELPNIQIGDKVLLSVKPTHISLSKLYPSKTTISNILLSEVIDVQNGEVLSVVLLKAGESMLESIITLEASKKLEIKKGDKVYALFKSSELFVKEV